ncbi:MAG: UDP-N-acetylmuramoyl-tripeptide--D-alanyl-D-alanine ligase, partial [Spirochaetes bacterium]|nr:UDP-N-acetylmuramoyl-tripeptide--D-alanyl-D-alanine ligase [Spirochaetota bacterium]
QQLRYYNLKFVKWLEGGQYKQILLWNIFELLVPLLIILILYYSIKQIPVYKYITSSIMLITFLWKLVHPFLAGWVGSKENIKIPLVYTPRVKRFILSLIFVIIIVLVFAFKFTASPLDTFTLSTWGFFKFNAFLLFISVITPILVLVANLINTPIEGLVHFVFFRKAKRKLNKTNLKKIAITGSYGKTSTKFFLSSLLMEKYKTLFTPASYNTPMGISKVINESQLDDYEIFVVEMGADRIGDIKKLCKLVNPDVGIISAIDIQHLESFGSLENIIETKLSLFSNLSQNSFGIFNYDSKILRDNIKKYNFTTPIYGYSMEEKNFDNVDIIAKNIKHTRNGLEFSVEFKTHEKLDVKTEVLGRHNTSNLLASILMAKLVGLSTNEIEKGIQKIKPVEHRLQKINSHAGILILDDAFNANLNGAHEALRVLKEIEGNKKIIVTPGLIGLGEKEDETNTTFGNYIAQYADIAILIGEEKTLSIYEGLIEKNFNKDNIKVVNSLNKAKGILQNIVTKGDIILFENDLPDTYNET